MKQLIYPHLGLFFYSLNNGIEQNEQLIPIGKKTAQGYPIDGLQYSCSLDDTDGLLALYSVNDADNNKPQDVSCLVELKKKILADSAVEEKNKIVDTKKVGKTWIILGIIPSFWDNLTAESLAEVAAKELKIGDFSNTVKLEEFMGAKVYEFWKPPSQRQDLEEESTHLLVFLYANQTALNSFEQFKQDWMRLFLYRHKILWAYGNTQNLKIKQFLRQHLLPANTTSTDINDTTSTDIQVQSPEADVLLGNLSQRKQALRDNYQILSQYANYITFLEVQLQTLQTNLYNYQERRQILLKKANKIGGATDPDFLKAFTEIPAKKCQMQIERDIATLTPGLKAREIFINTIRGSADIEQAESDRNIERNIAIAGFAIGTASAAASSISPFIETITQQPLKKIEKVETITQPPSTKVESKEILIPSNAWFNFLVAFGISIGVGIVFGFVTWGVWAFFNRRPRPNPPTK